VKTVLNKCFKKTFLLCPSLLILFLSSLVACSTLENQNSRSEAVILAESLQNGDRSSADKQRDGDRQPAGVLEFLGIGEDMSVLDVIAAGGYYTEVLSTAVGPMGKVYAQNPDFVLKFRDGANDKALSARLNNGRLSNVIRLDREIAELEIEKNSLDAAITALNLHDIYNRSPDAALSLLKAIKALLKPNGVLGLIDHRGNAGADNSKLHRMQLSQAVEVAKQAGFKVETSDLLSHSEDDGSQFVFAPGLRGKTDRFLLKLIKP
jgi:predicted methyltransferase